MEKMQVYIQAEGANGIVKEHKIFNLFNRTGMQSRKFGNYNINFAI